MKIKILSLFLGALSTLSVSAQFTLSGHISGMPDSLKLSVVNIENIERSVTLCEASPKDGTFVLQCDTLYNPTLCELRIMAYNPKNERYDVVQYVHFMAENTPMQMQSITMETLQAAAKEYREDQVVTITGGEAQTQWQEYLDQVFETELKAKLAGYALAMKYFESHADEDTVAKYDAIKQQADTELYRVRRDFIEQHPDYYLSAIYTDRDICTYFTYTADELRDMAARVQVCPDPNRVALINRHLEIALRFALQRDFGDFDVTNPEGNTVKFSSLCPTNALYTLVDFWASWCGPCRKAIPQIAELAKQYKQRLAVISISIDEREAAWRKAMEAEKMQWSQAWVSSTQSNAVFMSFAIMSIPRLILMDTDGRIVCSTFSPKVIKDYLSANMPE